MSSPTRKTAPTHPKVSIMVNTAILTLNEKKGSSLQAIKKYIDANYDADSTKLSTFIKKYLKSAIESGDIIQTKGKGASGSFCLKKQGKKDDKKPPSTAVKKPKPHMMTSTPKKVLQPKKKAMANKKEIPVQEDLDVPTEGPAKPVIKAAKKPKATKPLPAPTKGKTSLGSKTKVALLRKPKGAKPAVLTPKKSKVVETTTKKAKEPKAKTKKVAKE